MSPRSKPQPGSRAKRRAEQRRKRRKVATAVVSALMLVAAVTGIVLVVRSGDDGAAPSEPKRTQQTVLFQIKGPNGTAVGSTLLVHDPATSQGAGILVPPQVVTQVPGVGSMTFGKALQVAGTTGSANALADLLGIVVDGSWVVDGVSFQKLVDGIGGVSVDVDREVVRGQQVLVAAGPQKLNGSAALTYATFLAAGEQEQARQSRLQTVVDATLLNLPREVVPVLTKLGTGSQTTTSPSRLQELIRGLKADDDKGNLQYRVLPVIPVSSPNDEIVFRVDAQGVRGLVDEVLAASVPAGARAEGNRVLVLNGVGTPGLGAVVREKLLPAGFVFVGSRNAPRFDYTETEVLIKEPTADAIAAGRRVARAMGVPESSVKTSDQIGTIADMVVIVGADFKP